MLFVVSIKNIKVKNTELIMYQLDLLLESRKFLNNVGVTGYFTVPKLHPKITNFKEFKVLIESRKPQYMVICSFS